MNSGALQHRIAVSGLGVLLALLTGCAGGPTVRPPPPPHQVPVLFVHGTDETWGYFNPMTEAFERAGWARERLYAVRLFPNNGQVPIEVMAYQVRRAAASLLRHTGAERLDVVAYSQGALSARYWIQALGGQSRVRRFISISGPHHGTRAAYLLGDPAFVQMRPDSDFLRELDRYDDWGDTQVFTFWTPWDGTIIPARSAWLPGATEHVFHVFPHQLMLDAPCIITAAQQVLAPPVLAVPPRLLAPQGSP